MSKEAAMELVLDGVEIALKQSIQNSLIKDIPMVGTILKLYEVGASIRDRLYIAKLCKFLECLDEVPPNVKEEMKNSISSNAEEVQFLSQKIMLVIETQTDAEKSAIIANLFLAYLDKKISQAEFRRALDVTATQFLDDLKEFVGNTGYGFMRTTYEELERMGYAGLVGSPLIGMDKTSPAELKSDGWAENSAMVLYAISDFGSTYRFACQHGARLRRAEG